MCESVKLTIRIKVNVLQRLGMVHDDTDECRNMENFDTSIATSYFMYPKITGVNQIWSKCSKQSLSDFLK